MSCVTFRHWPFKLGHVTFKHWPPRLGDMTFKHKPLKLCHMARIEMTYVKLKLGLKFGT
jgi:hypothetical protein